jgi:hypothetical protein
MNLLTVVSSIIAAYLSLTTCLANIIYDNKTQLSKVTTKDNTTITTWDGVSGNSLVGAPYVTHIETGTVSQFNLEGFVLSGEINAVIQYGEVLIHGDSKNATILNVTILSETGERFVFLLENYINITIQPNSSCFFYGAPLSLNTSDPFVSESVIGGFPNLYSNYDFKGDDTHINNGSNKAINIAWNSTWYKSPWLIIKTKTLDGWVWWHQHPYGVVYIPLKGCIIYYCYTENDDECYKTTDGVLRYEKFGVVYREKIQVREGYDECIFGVTDFYINEKMGQPIFYPEPLNISSTVIRPLRSYFYT